MSGDSHLLHILEAHADDLLSERRTATGLRGMVENRLLSILPSGKVQTAVVARQLGMSERSFKRHLAQEGTSFGEVLDRLRYRLALRYLEDERSSIQQIAWLLGYSEIGAFNHAFKRWTGHRPAEREISQPYLRPPHSDLAPLITQSLRTGVARASLQITTVSKTAKTWWKRDEISARSATGPHRGRAGHTRRRLPGRWSLSSKCRLRLTPLTAGIAIGIQTVAASFVSKQLDTLRRQQGAFARSRLRPFALVGQ